MEQYVLRNFRKTEKRRALRGIYTRKFWQISHHEFLFQLIFLPEFLAALNGLLFANSTISRFSRETFPWKFPYHLFLFVVAKKSY